MSETDYKNLSVEELETLIQQNQIEVSLLQEKVNKTKKEQEENFKDILDLMANISYSEKQYYEYRLILGSPLIELTETERITIESMILITKQKIDKLKENFNNINLDEV